jgi:hypothetical protein
MDYLFDFSERLLAYPAVNFSLAAQSSSVAVSPLLAVAAKLASFMLPIVQRHYVAIPPQIGA